MVAEKKRARTEESEEDNFENRAQRLLDLNKKIWELESKLKKAKENKRKLLALTPDLTKMNSALERSHTLGTERLPDQSLLIKKPVQQVRATAATEHSESLAMMDLGN